MPRLVTEQTKAFSERRALNLNFAVALLDADFRLLNVNDAYLALFGGTTNAWLESGEADNFCLDAGRNSYRTLPGALGPGECQTQIALRHCREGRKAWIETRYTLLRADDDGMAHVVALSIDVTTARTHATDDHGQVPAIDQSHAVAEFDPDGFVLDANALFLHALGYTREDLFGRHHSGLVTPDTAQTPAYQAFWRDLAAGRHRAADYRRICQNGHAIWLRGAYNPVLDPAGPEVKIVNDATDVTAEKQRHADCQSQIEAIHKSHGVVELDLDGIILTANANFLGTFGYAIDEVAGQAHRMLVSPGVAESQEYADLWAALRSGSFQSGLYKRIDKAGNEIWLQATYNPVLDPNGQPYKIIEFATDVSANVEMARAYDKASRVAQHDATTALPNRLKIVSFIANALSHDGARLAVLYVDLDRFKPINDRYGHAVADRVLGEVADRLRRTISNDFMAARIGGNEFLIAAPGIRDDEIEQLCEALLNAIAQPLRHNEVELQLTASIGIAVSPMDGDSPDDLIKHADAALSGTKQRGRAKFGYYTAAMNDRLGSYSAMTEDMRRALARDEFVLDYQPRFCTKDKQIRGVEALVRWIHPERGRIPPGDFIPLAERNGLIIPLGKWVLDHACRFIAAQENAVRVSVNISPIQFRSDHLIDAIANALKTSGLAPERLELEITEGVLLEDGERARRLLKQIKALGVRLAIDDFGTGYSSLGYLRTFPFDALKIDRQFINDLNIDDGARAIVRAIVSLGRALGLEVTAEGIETGEQMDIVTQYQCNEVQGFLLARPLAPNVLSTRLSIKTPIYAKPKPKPLSKPRTTKTRKLNAAADE